MLAVATAVVYGAASALRVIETANHGAVRSVAALAALGTELILAGFVGTQRAWFLAAFRDENFGLPDATASTTRYVPRFVALGLLVFLPVVPWIVLVAGLHSSHPLEAGLLLAATLLLLDAFLTFVVPALAFTTNSAFEAVRIGRRMIGSTWPACAWYVVAPGLTLTLFVLLLPGSSLAGARVALGVVAALVALVLKGAIAAFYLRQDVPARISTSRSTRRR